ncbi:MAG: transposase [Candidatus Altiarchaeales archaeon]|nr:transposase [Candidatus Altiarchaeota archaeon]MBU4341200.1 transposase [Candidatus Altiarchaeota archaeon]MBU4437278.1 transposase [Candidatus Altiarchaeota archaeon]MCG2782011.1 transposase [Candidatus Altiarchaeales archaeon]
MDGRQMRGMKLADIGGIAETEKGWVVPSQFGNGAYLVQKKDEGYVCSCPDCQMRGVKCKHQWAVTYKIERKTDKDGNTTITKTTKVTYGQDWKAYTQAQTNEVELFDKLLSDLVEGVDEPEQKMGRPRLRTKDLLFCSIQKVYSQLSSRRARTLYNHSKDREHIGKAPNYNSINIFLNREDVTPILHKLLTLTAMPLKGIEQDFAVDSSGFRTTNFTEYARYKYKRGTHEWLKAHIMVGVKTNVIASAKVTDGNASDMPQFEPLVMDAYNNGFEMREISADKGYSSRNNHGVAQRFDARAYIPFRKNATGSSRGCILWWKAFNYFQLHQEEFMEHYHKRSNVESTFMMIKQKFGDGLKSKKFVSQKNELLCKLIAHNIVVLIHEMFELGIEPEFKNTTNST